MPNFDILKPFTPSASFRSKSVADLFTIDPDNFAEHFRGSIDIEGRDWNIGLIVGGSGTGKSTIARECFGSQIITGFDYPGESVIDDMPQGCSVADITRAFTSVGFASPPSWLKPYGVLSNGEKMRVDLARAMLESRDVFAFDEFTSVVDRKVAQTGSAAIAKAIRTAGRKFIAITCHHDVTDWLQPDWIFDTDQQRFFFVSASEDGQKSSYKFMKSKAELVLTCGVLSANITI